MRVERMLYGGSGVARNAADSNEEVLPFVLPGELVQINDAGTAQIVEASQNRTEPACKHFGECGGCHYQHASYSAQVEIKTGIVRGVFASAGLDDPPEVVVHTGEPLHYRNRIRLRVAKVNGEWRVGYNKRDAAGPGAMLPITMCPIASPLLWRAAETLLVLAERESLVTRWLGTADEIELFAAGDESKLQLTVFLRASPGQDFNRFCDLVQRQLPELAGAGVAILPAQRSQRGRRSERPKQGPQWGAPGMVYRVEEDKHWVSRGSFFQVNRFLASELVRLATTDRSGRLAWDLYAGVGLFSRALARSFAQVVAVEAAEPAAADLGRSLKGTSHRAVAMSTLDFLQAAVVQRERPDLIVMDPPRAGVGVEACSLLARVRAPEIVYVSCDPVTMARDLKQLLGGQPQGGGYTLHALHLVDMFPQTFHIECVAVLRLGER